MNEPEHYDSSGAGTLFAIGVCSLALGGAIGYGLGINQPPETVKADCKCECKWDRPPYVLSCPTCPTVKQPIIIER